MNGRKSLQILTSLQCVSSCPLEFYREPLCLRRAVARESKFSREQQLTIANEIKSFLAKGVFEPSVSEPNEVISPVFVRPKKDPKQFRVVFNLEALIKTLQTYVNRKEKKCIYCKRASIYKTKTWAHLM